MRYHGATLSTPVDLAAILERGLSLYPDAPALTTAEETYSWRTLDRHADAYAKNLLAAGLSPGDRVATFLPNSGPLIVHYLATQRAGLVAVPLNFRYTSFEIDHALDVSGARALVFDGDRRADVTAATRTSDLALTYVFGGGALEKGERDVADLFAEPPAGDLPPVAPDTPAVIFFTSGSTGPAKGVTHTHRTLGWMFASGARVYQLAPDDVFFPASSCSHVGGFLNTFASFSEGASVVVPRMGRHPQAA
ncbi:MAG: class I adenylate-forming enzyme family protein [Devosia sp.]